jgi:hypothetical protein
LIDRAVGDLALGITLEDAARYAEQKKALTEAALLQTAQLLCEFSGVSLPPWMNTHKEQSAPEQSRATPEAVVAVDASDAPTTQSNFMKKVALIAELEYEWPSIVTDMHEASRNKLKVAAHTGRHGEWYRDKARAWAVSNGKIKKAAPVHSLAAVWPSAATRKTKNY